MQITLIKSLTMGVNTEIKNRTNDIGSGSKRPIPTLLIEIKPPLSGDNWLD